VQIVDIRERSRQVVVDEPQGASQALEAQLHENAGGILDVVASRLHQPRRLPQLREHSPGALGERRVLEQHLARQAGRQDLGIRLQAPFPRPHAFQLEETGTDAGLEGRTLQAFDLGQALRIDGGESTSETAELPHLRIDRLAAEVLQQVVVRVDPVEGRHRGMELVEVGQVLVDKMRKGFG
jgi:hypothetical protein